MGNVAKFHNAAKYATKFTWKKLLASHLAVSSQSQSQIPNENLQSY